MGLKGKEKENIGEVNLEVRKIGKQAVMFRKALLFLAPWSLWQPHGWFISQFPIANPTGTSGSKDLQRGFFFKAS